MAFVPVNTVSLIIQRWKLEDATLVATDMHPNVCCRVTADITDMTLLGDRNDTVCGHLEVPMHG